MALSEEQRICENIATKGHNLLITGQCGTGKTFLLRKIIRSLQSKEGSCVAITSTTGIGSTQLGHGASTLHKWAGLGDGRYSAEELLNLFQSDERFVDAKRRIKMCQSLVIDEIGMLSKKLLEVLEVICRKIRERTTAFGGIQIIACGDFRQLPPISNRRYDDDGSYCFESNVFKNTLIHHIRLTKVIRQEEADLAHAVNELCCGNPSEATHKLIKELDRPLAAELAEKATLLFGSNFDVEYTNGIMLEKLDGEQRVYKSEDRGSKRVLITSRAQKTLVLKNGAPVILIRNLSSALVNGTKGAIHDISGADPVINVEGSLHTVNKSVFEIYDAREKKVLATRVQYPIKLAFAITIHRAQGLTLHPLIVDCTGIYIAGQIGVAVGRAKYKDGLRVKNYSKDIAEIKHPDCVDDFLKRDSTEPLDDLSCCKHIAVVDDVLERSNKQHVLLEPITTHAQSYSTPKHADTCPLKFEDFKSLNQDKPYMESCTELTPQQIQIYMDLIYSVIHRAMTRVVKDNAWNNYFQDVNSFLTSKEHVAAMQMLFSTQSLSPTQNKLSTKLTLWVSDMLIKQKAADAKNDWLLSSQPTTKQTQYLDAAQMGKIEYLAGRCIQKVRSRLMDSVRRKVGKTGIQSLNMKVDYHKSVLLQKLRITESKAQLQFGQTPEILSEISAKQTHSRGLTIVNRNVFDFFIQIFKICSKTLSIESIHRNATSIHYTARKALESDQKALQAWLDLFDSEQVDCDDEMFEVMVLDLYYQVCEHFLRVAMIEALHKFKESLLVKKTQVLRSSLASGSAPKTLKRKAEETRDDDGVYKCGTCKEILSECPETEKEESIGCDACDRWFHTLCQGVTCKQKKSARWTCTDCKQSGSGAHGRGGARQGVSGTGLSKSGKGKGRGKKSSKEN